MSATCLLLIGGVAAGCAAIAFAFCSAQKTGGGPGEEKSGGGPGEEK